MLFSTKIEFFNKKIMNIIYFFIVNFDEFDGFDGLFKIYDTKIFFKKIVFS